MTSNSIYGHAHGQRDISAQRSGDAGEPPSGTANPCKPLEEEIEVLEEQISMLEEGLPRAPGMERAALAKEIAGYRRELDARQHALLKCRNSMAVTVHDM